MKRTLYGLFGLAVMSMVLVSCSTNYYNGGSTSTGGSVDKSRPSQLAFRAFVSNPLQTFTVGGAVRPVLNIVDASVDRLSFALVGLPLDSEPGLMALSPNKLITMVFSTSNNTIIAVDNSKEAQLANSSATVPTIPIPGQTESMLIAPDNSTAYAAVPTAPVSGTPPTPGAVEVMNLTSGTLLASIPVAGARTLVQSHDGNRILVFGENSNTVTVLTPANVHTSVDPRTPVCCFDHPVGGIFSSDDTAAYILNCGPECGGTTAGITVLNLNTNSIGATVPLPDGGATVGLLQGSNLYLAGTPPNTPCASGTLASTCGVLTTIDVSSMTVSTATPILITDGYHTRMAMGANSRLFIGAKDCTNINNSTEVRGCLSIVNLSNSNVVIPPDTGNVTGMQAITSRNVVYVCEGGNIRIYDTTTDVKVVPPAGLNDIDIIGQSTDVKLVD